MNITSEGTASLLTPSRTRRYGAGWLIIMVGVFESIIMVGVFQYIIVVGVYGLSYIITSHHGNINKTMEISYLRRVFMSVEDLSGCYFSLQPILTKVCESCTFWR